MEHITSGNYQKYYEEMYKNSKFLFGILKRGNVHPQTVRKTVFNK